MEFVHDLSQLEPFNPDGRTPRFPSHSRLLTCSLAEYPLDLYAYSIAKELSTFVSTIKDALSNALREGDIATLRSIASSLLLLCSHRPLVKELYDAGKDPVTI